MALENLATDGAPKVAQIVNTKGNVAKLGQLDWLAGVDRLQGCKFLENQQTWKDGQTSKRCCRAVARPVMMVPRSPQDSPAQPACAFFATSTASKTSALVPSATVANT